MNFTIQGGYGLIRRKRSDDPNKADLLLATPRDLNLGCWMDHPLTVVVPKGIGVMESSTITVGQNNHYFFAKLAGPCTFTEGMPTDAVVWPAHNSPKGPKYVPEPASEKTKWDNLGWIYSLGTAPADVEQRVAASLRFTGGKLKVMAPDNPYGRLGRWVLKRPNGSEERQALSDTVELGYTAEVDALVIRQSDAKELKLRPESGRLQVYVYGSVPPLENMCFKPGEKLPHFDSLYSLKGDIPCNERVVPQFEHVEGEKYPTCEKLTPGNFCPPVYLTD